MLFNCTHYLQPERKQKLLWESRQSTIRHVDSRGFCIRISSSIVLRGTKKKERETQQRHCSDSWEKWELSCWHRSVSTPCKTASMPANNSKAGAGHLAGHWWLRWSIHWMLISLFPAFRSSYYPYFTIYINYILSYVGLLEWNEKLTCCTLINYCIMYTHIVLSTISYNTRSRLWHKIRHDGID